jgi:hypothetical protein
MQQMSRLSQLPRCRVPQLLLLRRYPRPHNLQRLRTRRRPKRRLFNSTNNILRHPSAEAASATPVRIVIKNLLPILRQLLIIHLKHPRFLNLPSILCHPKVYMKHTLLPKIQSLNLRQRYCHLSIFGDILISERKVIGWR